MAALTITAAQVLLAAGPSRQVTFGATITQGQSLYYDVVSGTWKLAQNDGTAAEAGADGYGISLTAGAAGQKGVIAEPGAKVTLGAGAAPAAGEVYCLGPTAGALNPRADMVSTNKVTPLCYGVGANAVQIVAGAYNAGSVLA